MGTRGRPTFQEKQVQNFGWYFTGHLFPTKVITKSGYPAWISLKAALEVPHIEDLLQADGIQLNAFRTHFTKEGLAFEEERREMINKLAQEIVIWAQGVSEFYLNWKPESTWTAESLPLICIDLFKEFGVNRSAAAEVKDTYKYLLSFAGEDRTLKRFLSHWPHQVSVNEIFFDSDGESDGCKKRKREIKESKALMAVTSRDEPEEDPDLFGDDDDEPTSKELKIN